MVGAENALPRRARWAISAIRRSRTFFSIPADPTADSLTQSSDVEVDEKPNALVTQFEVGEQLRFVNRQDCFNRFYFDDHFAFDEEVDTVTEFNNDAVVFDWKWFFGLERHVKTLQFVAQTGPVRPFEKPRTEL